jgi:hypothetical protein
MLNKTEKYIILLPSAERKKSFFLLFCLSRSTRNERENTRGTETFTMSDDANNKKLFYQF